MNKRIRTGEDRSVRGPVDGRSWLWWVIDNVMWTDSWPSITGAGCGLICVGASEEWARKVYALRGLRGVERQVGLTRGTRWPAGSSADRMVARKARRSRRPEPVQGSGSCPESARGVCGGSPKKTVGLLGWATKQRPEARRAETGSGLAEKLWYRRTHGGIAGRATGEHDLRWRRGRAMKRSATWPICP
jgi:hypothetical protein